MFPIKGHDEWLEAPYQKDGKEDVEDELILCPQCGEEDLRRNSEDEFRCPCGYTAWSEEEYDHDCHIRSLENEIKKLRIKAEYAAFLEQFYKENCWNKVENPPKYDGPYETIETDMDTKKLYTSQRTYLSCLKDPWGCDRVIAWRKRADPYLAFPGG